MQQSQVISHNIYCVTFLQLGIRQCITRTGSHRDVGTCSESSYTKIRHIVTPHETRVKLKPRDLAKLVDLKLSICRRDHMRPSRPTLFYSPRADSLPSLYENTVCYSLYLCLRTGAQLTALSRARSHGFRKQNIVSYDLLTWTSSFWQTRQMANRSCKIDAIRRQEPSNRIDE